MADTNPGEPLQATVGDQLRGKAEAEERASDERQETERRHGRIERQKADERESVLRHTGGQRRLRPRRGIAGPRPALAAMGFPSWAVPAAIVAGLWFARRSRLALFAGAAAGLAMWASRAEERVEPW